MWRRLKKVFNKSVEETPKMAGIKREISYQNEGLFDFDQPNAKKPKHENTVLHQNTDVGPILEPMTSSEQILLKEIDAISQNADLILEGSFFSPIFKILPDQGPRPFQCSLCQEVFKFYASLICHVKVVHENLERHEDFSGVKMEPLEEFRDFPCDFCEATFPNNIQRFLEYFGS